jgi:hypothetical protein
VADGQAAAPCAPILQPREIGLPAVVSRFLDALAAGDAEAAVSAFAPTGYLRESLPQLDAHRGTAELRSFLAQQLSVGGGMAPQLCSVTDDGVRYAVEFNCTRWGTRDLPLQAGIGVYERDADGLLAAARVYDDIESPAPSTARNLPCRRLGERRRSGRRRQDLDGDDSFTDRPLGFGAGPGSSSGR